MSTAKSRNVTESAPPTTNGSYGITPRPEPFNGVMVVIIGLVLGISLSYAGVIALNDPGSYRDLVDLQASDAFTRLSGGVQLGLGLSLLLGLIWREALTTILAGTFVGSLTATVVSARSDEVEGTTTAMFATGTVLAALAFLSRYRRQGLIVGDTGPGASDPALTPFVRQKTMLLTSYKRDGMPVGTPVSVAVDGDRAYARTFTNAYKTKRISRNPHVELAPCTMKGKPTGPSVSARAQRIDGEEYRRAGHLLSRKYPLVHGVLVPFAHKVLARKKSGPTVHLALHPTTDNGGPHDQ